MQSPSKPGRHQATADIEKTGSNETDPPKASQREHSALEPTLVDEAENYSFIRRTSSQSPDWIAEARADMEWIAENELDHFPFKSAVGTHSKDFETQLFSNLIVATNVALQLSDFSKGVRHPQKRTVPEFSELRFEAIAEHVMGLSEDRTPDNFEFPCKILTIYQESAFPFLLQLAINMG